MNAAALVASGGAPGGCQRAGGGHGTGRAPASPGRAGSSTRGPGAPAGAVGKGRGGGVRTGSVAPGISPDPLPRVARAGVWQGPPLPPTLMPPGAPPVPPPQCSWCHLTCSSGPATSLWLALMCLPGAGALGAGARRGHPGTSRGAAAPAGRPSDEGGEGDTPGNPQHPPCTQGVLGEPG